MATGGRLTHDTDVVDFGEMINASCAGGQLDARIGDDRGLCSGAEEILDC